MESGNQWCYALQSIQTSVWVSVMVVVGMVDVVMQLVLILVVMFVVVALFLTMNGASRLSSLGWVTWSSPVQCKASQTPLPPYA
jgi:hypothetical protein